MTGVTIVYLLILTTGNLGPTTKATYATWYECEQVRIKVERQTNMTGRCNAVSKSQGQSLLHSVPLPKPRVRIRHLLDLPKGN